MVLDYHGKFKKSGDPLKSPIDQAEFLEIMQVEKKESLEENLPKMSNSKGGGTDAFAVLPLTID